MLQFHMLTSINITWFASRLSFSASLFVHRQQHLDMGCIHDSMLETARCCVMDATKGYTACLIDVYCVLLSSYVAPVLQCCASQVMCDEKHALCLTPQAFHNINPHADIFNNINLQFWEYWLPGADAWGYIACTGQQYMPCASNFFLKLFVIK